MAINYNPRIVTDGLVLFLDAGNPKSYPGSGSTWFDLSDKRNNASISSGTTYSPAYNGSLFFDGTSLGRVTTTGFDWNAIGSTRNFTVMLGFAKAFYGTGGNNTGDSILFFGATNGYNNGWRIIEVSTGTPGAPFTGNQQFYYGSPGIDPNGYIIVQDDQPRRMGIGAISVNASSVYAFLNNNVSISNSFPSYVSGGSSGVIGSANNQFGVGRFNGYLSFVMVYQRPLSASEISQNFNATRGRFGI